MDVKGLGARWDPNWDAVGGRWWVPAGTELAPFSRWLVAARTYLRCPYAEHKVVKALGADWDNGRFDGVRQWYVRGNSDLRPFARWL